MHSNVICPLIQPQLPLHPNYQDINNQDRYDKQSQEHKRTLQKVCETDSQKSAQKGICHDNHCTRPKGDVNVHPNGATL